MKKIAVFADVQNIYYTTKQAYGRQFNYRRLWQMLEREGEVATALAYAIDRGDSKQQGFQSALRDIGFEIKLKPFIQRVDGTAKGDWDVGITIDVIESAAHVDTIVLLSGDGDFQLLVDHVKQKNAVETVVYGVPGLTAKALSDAADHYRPIAESLLL
ncbi:MAG: NYN domain-containing protein [Granulosicoccus sp.]|nr:NYN domain-containing protein [Granulosicoccus sp.]